MLDLRTQIRTYVDDTIERLDSDDIVAAASARRPMTGQAAWYARPVWVAIGAAALALIAIGLPVLLIRGGESTVIEQPTTSVASEVTPTTTATTIAPTVTTITPTTTVPLIPARLEVTWQQAPTQASFGPNDVVRSIVEGGPGLVAVGGTWSEAANNYQAVVWTSVDGVDWNRASNVPSLVSEYLNDVAFGPAGFVTVTDDASVSAGTDNPQVMVSMDGETWSTVPPEADDLPNGTGLAAVTHGGPGYVAVGALREHGEPSEASIWTSTDGIAWTRIKQALGEGYGFSAISDIVNTGSVLVAVGTAWNDGGDWRDLQTVHDDLLVWTSVDGQVWTREMLSDETGVAIAVATHDESIIAVGHEGVTVTAWLADDAGEPFTARQIPGYATAWPLGVLGDGDRLLVVGVQRLASTTYAMAWTSQGDGATWYEVTFEGYSIEGRFGEPSDGMAAGFRAVTAFGDGFVAVGSTGDASAPVWTGAWNED